MELDPDMPGEGIMNVKDKNPPVITESGPDFNLQPLCFYSDI